MQLSEREAKSILTEQTSGFLMDGEFPFTHSLSPYTGCAFGNTTCGLYCYAAALPSWTYRGPHLRQHPLPPLRLNRPGDLGRIDAAGSTPGL